jgi:ribosomal protein S18 acetylase RimI-like enzyme
MRLVETAVDWARNETDLAWIDLEVMADNVPAVELYLRSGFTMVARIADMLRVDGASHDLCCMTLKLR